MAGFQQLKVTREVDFSGAALIGLTPDLPGTDFFVTKTGNDGNDGLGWTKDRAFLTIGKALEEAASVGPSAAYRRGGVRIFVGGGYYEEELDTPTNDQCPFGQLIGYSPSDVSRGCVYVYSGDAAEPWLTVLARGWRISGFEIQCGTSDAGIYLDDTTDNASYTQIDHCHFTAGLYGINAVGAPNYVHILNNEFSVISGAAGFAIGATAGANCNVWHIEGNTFTSNYANIVFVSAASPQGGTIIHNVLGAPTAGKSIDLTDNAGSCVITQNFLGGESFSLDGDGGIGGFRGCIVADNEDEWWGNYANLTGGITVAAPV